MGEELTQEQITEHEQAMVDVAEGNETKTQTSLQSDEEILLAGKYKSVEELEKGYEELQSKLGQKPEAETEEAKEEVKEETVETTTEAKEAVEEAGLDFDALHTEFVDNEGLSNETYERLGKAGISKEVVDNYIAGQEAIQQKSIDNIMTEVGGAEVYQDMMTWANSNLTEGEQQAFNKSLDDEDSARFSIQGLHARYKAASPSLIGGNRTTGASQSSGGFATKSEMMKAMGSREYKTDSTYRAVVQRQVALSSFL